MKILSRQELVDSPNRDRPHVVILGAGASKAAFPNGDATGQLVPLMKEIPEVLGRDWKELVKGASLKSGDFESQYIDLRENARHHDRLDEVERVLCDYFGRLALPDHPTIYDYLVLGLRSKDVIATFNWDPFLILAHRRNNGICKLPEIRFLHGCVRFASCIDHDVLGGPLMLCPECLKPLTKSSILFPRADKDYTKDSIVFREWEFVTGRLREAVHLTIFGYSGPSSDYKAKKLLLEGWERTPMRKFSHVEIIDVGSPDKLRSNWNEFIPFDHDMLTACFWKSTIAKWPRRTAEYKMAASLFGTVSEYIGPIRTNSLEELQQWHEKIAVRE